jgi:glycosyltransferase involved in cell wall biosynthesis
MRVAYVSADAGVPVFGRKGCSVHVQEVVRALREEGAQVELFAARCDGAAPDDLADVTVHPLCGALPPDLARREQALLLVNDVLRRKLDDRAPFDLVYERHALWSYAAQEWAKAAGIPSLLEVNAPLIEEQEQHRGLVDRQRARWAARRAFAAASALIAVSDGVATYLGRCEEAKGPVHVVPNGVRPDRFSPTVLPARPRSNDVFRIGFVGSLKPWHGLTNLLDAFQILHAESLSRPGPRPELLIVGDGPLRLALEHQFHSASFEARQAICLVGAVPPDHIPRWMASMDVGVAPYPRLADFYFSPLKIVEYMAAGLPVVASQVGTVPRLVQDGQTGLLCPPDDPRALAEVLKRLMFDRPLRGRLGEAGRRQVEEHYTWQSVVRRLLQIAGLMRPTTTEADTEGADIKGNAKVRARIVATLANAP